MTKRIKMQKVVASFVLIAMVGVNAPAFGVSAQTTIIDGDLIKTAASSDIYIVKVVGAKQFKRLILNPDIFKSYGHLNWGNVKTVSDSEMASFVESQIVRAVGDPKVYRLTSSSNADTGVKAWLNMSAAEFVAEGYDWDSIYEINTTERDLYTSGADIVPAGKGGNPEPENNGVTITLASDSPQSTSVARGASSAVFAKINFVNGNAQNAVVTAITVTRNGLAQDTDLTEVRIFDGSTQLGSPAALNQTTHKAAFTGLSWVIPSGQTKTLAIKANVSSSATTGNAPRLSIASAKDVITNSEINGVFPISSNAMTIAGLTVGRLDVTAQSIPADAQPVAGSTDREIASWKLDAVSEGMRVERIVITQVGSAANEDVKNIKLKVNGSQIGQTINAFSNALRTAEFDLSSNPLIINADTSKTFYAHADIGTGQNISNRNVKFEITNSADVTVFGANSGNQIQITTDEGGDGSTFIAQDGVAQTIKLGGGFTVTINGATNPSAKAFVNGRTQELISAFRFSAGSGEDMRVVRVKLTLFGTGAGATDLSNVTLYKYDPLTGSETQVGTPTSFLGTAATYGLNTSALDPALFEVKKSDNTIIHVRADISTSASYIGLGIAVNEVKVDGVQSKTDIASSDISISAVDATDGTETTLHSANLSSGTLALTISPNNPAGQDIAPGSNDYTFGKFDLTATGEDIVLSSLTLNLCDGASCADGSAGTAESGDFANVKLYLDATQLGTTVASPTASASFNFNLIIKKDQTLTLSVTSDVPTNAASDWASAKAAVALDRDITATGVSSGATISDPSSDALGNAMTAIAETLTVSFQSVPSSTLVKNGSSAVIAKFVLTSGTAGDVRVSSIKFSADDVTALNSTSAADTTFGSLKLYDVTSGETQLGTIMSSFTNGTPDTLTFSALALTIQKNTSKVLELRANLLATTSADLYVGIADLTTTGGSDVVATGLLSNTTVYGSGTDADDSGTITVASAGSLTVSVDASTPASKIVAVGTSGLSDVEFAKFKFSATNEAILLKGVKVTLAQSDSPSSANDVPNFSTIKLYNGATLLATEYLTGSNASAVVTRTINLNGNSVTIPRGGNVVLTLKADLNGTAIGAVSMSTPNFYIADVAGAADMTASDLEAKGVDSGVNVTSAAGSKDPSTTSGSPAQPTNVNAMTVTRSKPILALSSTSPSGALVPGVSEVIRFTINAEGDDVVFDGTNHNIRFTIAQSGGTAVGKTARILEVGKGTALQTIDSIDLTSVGTINLNTISTTIAKGTSKEFYVTVDLSDYSTTGETFRLSIGSATADLSWGDGVTTDITTTLTDGLPLTGGTLVK